MAIVSKIDSNVTGLRYAEELSLGVLPVTPDWIPLEPNTYADFGGQITTVARNPINPSRQRKKGVVTDLEASGGFNMDMTQTNLQDILQGFMFADLRPKGEEDVTAVSGGGVTNDYDVALTAGFKVDDLVKATGLALAGNNGIKLVDTVTLDTSISVVSTLVDEVAAPAGANLVVVGVQGQAGDINVDASGVFPTLTSTVLDFTTLGLVPGERIFNGGDLTAEQFLNTENNGYKRVRSIAANVLTLDKSDTTMVTEVTTTETIRLFFGRVLKNETGALIKRRTYNLERTLGAPDDALPAEVQAEYLEGAVPSEFTLNVSSADKATVDLSFDATNSTTVDGPTPLKTGNRPALVESDAFNTSSDVSNIKLSIFDGTTSNPTPLFAFVQELTLPINNNTQLNKAIGVLGACGVSVGTFEVGGSMTAYFQDVAATEAIRNNADITLHMDITKSNAGVSFDVPLITLGDGRPNVEQDQPITLPLTQEAATGAKIDPAMDHTLLWVFFDYLPDLADT